MKSQTSFYLRGIAFATALVLGVTQVFPGRGLAVEPTGGSVLARSVPVAPETFSIPEAQGHIESRFKAPESGSPFVILIRDVHAVREGQENIQKLLGYLQSNYGIDQVAVEGGEGEFDTTLLRAFPDEATKEKVIRGYVERAELTGTEAASILNLQEGRYFGIEKSELYEANYRAYLAAAENQAPAAEALGALRAKLDEKRKSMFPAKLIELQDRIEEFKRNNALLVEFVKYLHSLETAPAKFANYPSLQKFLATISFEEESGADEEDRNLQIRQIAGELKRRHERRMGAETRKRFHRDEQAFLTGEMGPASFVQRLVEAGKELGIRLKMTPSLVRLLGHQQTLESIKGTKLFDELEGLVRELSIELAGNEQGRELVRQYAALETLQSLAALELDRAAWDRFEANPEETLSLVDDGAQELLASAQEFYRFARQRDQAFTEGLQKLLANRKSEAVAVVAGGFHTEGLGELLREKKVSHAVILPKMNSFAGHELYHRVLRNEISFAKLLKESYYDGFMKDAASRLASEMNESDFGRELKAWRDGVVKRLARENRLGETGKYTGYLDQLLKVYYEKFGKERAKSREEILKAFRAELDDFRATTLKRSWQTFEMQLKAFTEGLRSLAERREANLQSIASLFDRVNRIRAAHLGKRIYLIPPKKVPTSRGFPSPTGATKRETPAFPPFAGIRGESRSVSGPLIAQILQEAVKLLNGFDESLKEAAGDVEFKKAAADVARTELTRIVWQGQKEVAEKLQGPLMVIFTAIELLNVPNQREGVRKNYANRRDVAIARVNELYTSLVGASLKLDEDERIQWITRPETRTAKGKEDLKLGQTSSGIALKKETVVTLRMGPFEVRIVPDLQSPKKVLFAYPGGTFLAEAGEIVRIGRDKTNQIVTGKESVSRFQAAVSVTEIDGRIVVRAQDIFSRNGAVWTWKDASRIINGVTAFQSLTSQILPSSSKKIEPSKVKPAQVGEIVARFNKRLEAVESVLPAKRLDAARKAQAASNYLKALLPILLDRYQKEFFSDGMRNSYYHDSFLFDEFEKEVSALEEYLGIEAISEDDELRDDLRSAIRDYQDPKKRKDPNVIKHLDELMARARERGIIQQLLDSSRTEAREEEEGEKGESTAPDLSNASRPAQINNKLLNDPRINVLAQLDADFFRELNQSAERYAGTAGPYSEEGYLHFLFEEKSAKKLEVLYADLLEALSGSFELPLETHIKAKSKNVGGKGVEKMALREALPELQELSNQGQDSADRRIARSLIGKLRRVYRVRETHVAPEAAWELVSQKPSLKALLSDVLEVRAEAKKDEGAEWYGKAQKRLAEIEHTLKGSLTAAELGALFSELRDLEKEQLEFRPRDKALLRQILESIRNVRGRLRAAEEKEASQSQRIEIIIPERMVTTPESKIIGHLALVWNELQHVIEILAPGKSGFRDVDEALKELYPEETPSEALSDEFAPLGTSSDYDEGLVEGLREVSAQIYRLQRNAGEILKRLTQMQDDDEKRQKLVRRLKRLDRFIGGELERLIRDNPNWTVQQREEALLGGEEAPLPKAISNWDDFISELNQQLKKVGRPPLRSEARHLRLSPDELAVEDQLERLFELSGVERRNQKGEETDVGIHLPTAIPVVYAVSRLGTIARDRPLKVLDLGSGQGEFSLRMAKLLGGKVDGIEYDKTLFDDSQKLLETAEKENFIREGQAAFHQGDFNDPKFAPLFQEADIVYYYGLSTFNANTLARTLARSLTKPGALLINVGATEQLEERLARNGFHFKVVEEEPSVAIKVYERLPSAEGRGEAREAEGEPELDLDVRSWWNADSAEIHVEITERNRMVHVSRSVPRGQGQLDDEFADVLTEALNALLKELSARDPLNFSKEYQLLAVSRKGEDGPRLVVQVHHQALGHTHPVADIDFGEPLKDYLNVSLTPRGAETIGRAVAEVAWFTRLDRQIERPSINPKGILWAGLLGVIAVVILGIVALIKSEAQDKGVQTRPTPAKQEPKGRGEARTFLKTPSLESYRNLSKEAKDHLRELARQAFSEREKEHDYKVEERLRDLVAAAEELKRDHPQALFLALGASGEWLVRTLELLYPSSESPGSARYPYRYAAFSGGSSNTGDFIDLYSKLSGDKKEGYKSYLLNRVGLTPDAIKDASEMVIPDYVRSGTSLHAFLNILEHDLGIDRRTLQSKLHLEILEAAVENEWDEEESLDDFRSGVFADRLRNEFGYKNNFRTLSRPLLPSLTRAEGYFGDRWIPWFPPEEWPKGYPREGETPEKAALMYFSLIDYLVQANRLMSESRRAESPIRVPRQAVVERREGLGEVADVGLMGLTAEEKMALAEQIVELEEPVNGLTGPRFWAERFERKDWDSLMLVNEGELKGFLSAEKKEEPEPHSYLTLIVSKRDEIRGKGTFLMDVYFQKLQREKTTRVVWHVPQIKPGSEAAELGDPVQFYKKFLNAKMAEGVVAQYKIRSRSFDVELNLPEAPSLRRRAETRQSESLLPPILAVIRSEVSYRRSQIASNDFRSERGLVDGGEKALDQMIASTDAIGQAIFSEAAALDRQAPLVYLMIITEDIIQNARKRPEIWRMIEKALKIAESFSQMAREREDFNTMRHGLALAERLQKIRRPKPLPGETTKAYLSRLGLLRPGGAVLDLGSGTDGAAGQFKPRTDFAKQMASLLGLNEFYAWDVTGVKGVEIGPEGKAVERYFELQGRPVGERLMKLTEDQFKKSGDQSVTRLKGKASVITINGAFHRRLDVLTEEALEAAAGQSVIFLRFSVVDIRSQQGAIESALNKHFWPLEERGFTTFKLEPDEIPADYPQTESGRGSPIYVAFRAESRDDDILATPDVLSKFADIEASENPLLRNLERLTGSQTLATEIDHYLEEFGSLGKTDWKEMPFEIVNLLMRLQSHSKVQGKVGNLGDVQAQLKKRRELLVALQTALDRVPEEKRTRVTSLAAQVEGRLEEDRSIAAKIDQLVRGPDTPKNLDDDTEVDLPTLPLPGGGQFYPELLLKEEAKGHPVATPQLAPTPADDTIQGIVEPFPLKEDEGPPTEELTSAGLTGQESTDFETNEEEAAPQPQVVQIKREKSRSEEGVRKRYPNVPFLQDLISKFRTRNGWLEDLQWTDLLIKTITLRMVQNTQSDPRFKDSRSRAEIAQGLLEQFSRTRRVRRGKEIQTVNLMKLLGQQYARSLKLLMRAEENAALDPQLRLAYLHLADELSKRLAYAVSVLRAQLVNYAAQEIITPGGEKQWVLTGEEEQRRYRTLNTMERKLNSWRLPLPGDPRRVSRLQKAKYEIEKAQKSFKGKRAGIRVREINVKEERARAEFWNAMGSSFFVAVAAGFAAFLGVSIFTRILLGGIFVGIVVAYFAAVITWEILKPRPAPPSSRAAASGGARRSEARNPEEVKRNLDFAQKMLNLQDGNPNDEAFMNSIQRAFHDMIPKVIQSLPPVRLTPAVIQTFASSTRLSEEQRKQFTQLYRRIQNESGRANRTLRLVLWDMSNQEMLLILLKDLARIDADTGELANPEILQAIRLTHRAEARYGLTPEEIREAFATENRDQLLLVAAELEQAAGIKSGLTQREIASLAEKYQELIETRALGFGEIFLLTSLGYVDLNTGDGYILKIIKALWDDLIVRKNWELLSTELEKHFRQDDNGRRLLVILDVAIQQKGNSEEEIKDILSTFWSRLPEESDTDEIKTALAAVVREITRQTKDPREDELYKAVRSYLKFLSQPPLRQTFQRIVNTEDFKSFIENVNRLIAQEAVGTSTDVLAFMNLTFPISVAVTDAHASNKLSSEEKEHAVEQWGKHIYQDYGDKVLAVFSYYVLMNELVHLAVESRYLSLLNQWAEKDGEIRQLIVESLIAHYEEPSAFKVFPLEIINFLEKEADEPRGSPLRPVLQKLKQYYNENSPPFGPNIIQRLLDEKNLGDQGHSEAREQEQTGGFQGKTRDDEAEKQSEHEKIYAQVAKSVLPDLTKLAQQGIDVEGIVEEFRKNPAFVKQNPGWFSGWRKSGRDREEVRQILVNLSLVSTMDPEKDRDKLAALLLAVERAVKETRSEREREVIVASVEERLKRIEERLKAGEIAEGDLPGIREDLNDAHDDLLKATAHPKSASLFQRISKIRDEIDALPPKFWEERERLTREKVDLKEINRILSEVREESLAFRTDFERELQKRIDALDQKTMIVGLAPMNPQLFNKIVGEKNVENLAFLQVLQEKLRSFRAEARREVRAVGIYLGLAGSLAAAYGIGAYFGSPLLSVLSLILPGIWLASQTKEYRELFENAPTPYHRLDAKGRIVDVNRKWLETMGYADKKEVIGREIFGFITHPAGKEKEEEEQENARRRFEERLKYGYPVTDKIGVNKQKDRAYQRRDGTLIFVQTHDDDRKNWWGKVIGVQTSFEDMTKQRKAEEKLRQSYEHLEAANQELQEMYLKLEQTESLRLIKDILEGVLFKIRTELGNNVSWTQLGMQLTKNPGDNGGVAAVMESLETALVSAQETERVVYGLEYLLKPDSGVSTQMDVHLLLGQILSELEKEAKTRWPKKEVRFLQKYSQNVADIYSNRDQLRWIFGRLLEQAAELTGPSGGVVEVATDGSQENGVEISFRVAGVVLDQKSREDLFNPRTKVVLPVVSALVERNLGGRFIDSSRDGEGTEFKIFLPSRAESRYKTLKADEAPEFVEKTMLKVDTNGGSEAFVGITKKGERYLVVRNNHPQLTSVGTASIPLDLVPEVAPAYEKGPDRPLRELTVEEQDERNRFGNLGFSMPGEVVQKFAFGLGKNIPWFDEKLDEATGERRKFIGFHFELPPGEGHYLPLSRVITKIRLDAPPIRTFRVAETPEAPETLVEATETRSEAREGETGNGPFTLTELLDTESEGWWEKFSSFALPIAQEHHKQYKWLYDVSQTEVGDMLSEMALKVWQKKNEIPSYEYLVAVVKNKLKDIRRRDSHEYRNIRRFSQDVLEGIPSKSENSREEMSELLQKVLDEVSKFRSREQQIFRAVVDEGGFEIKEGQTRIRNGVIPKIAVETGMSEIAVRTALSRMRTQLRSKFMPQPEPVRGPPAPRGESRILREVLRFKPTLEDRSQELTSEKAFSEIPYGWARVVLQTILRDSLGRESIDSWNNLEESLKRTYSLLGEWAPIVLNGKPSEGGPQTADEIRLEREIQTHRLLKLYTDILADSNLFTESPYLKGLQFVASFDREALAKAHYRPFEIQDYLLANMKLFALASFAVPLDEGRLYELYEEVKTHMSPNGKALGSWRDSPAQDLRTGYRYPDPERLREFVKRHFWNWWYSAEFRGMDPIHQARHAYFRFSRLRPLPDGNGRMADMIANYLLIRSGRRPYHLGQKNYLAYDRAIQKNVPANFDRFEDDSAFNAFIERSSRRYGQFLEDSQDSKKPRQPEVNGEAEKTRVPLEGRAYLKPDSTLPTVEDVERDLHLALPPALRERVREFLGHADRVLRGKEQPEGVVDSFQFPETTEAAKFFGDHGEAAIVFEEGGRIYAYRPFLEFLMRHSPPYEGHLRYFVFASEFFRWMRTLSSQEAASFGEMLVRDLLAYFQAFFLGDPYTYGSQPYEEELGKFRPFWAYPLSPVAQGIADQAIHYYFLHLTREIPIAQGERDFQTTRQIEDYIRLFQQIVNRDPGRLAIFQAEKGNILRQFMARIAHEKVAEVLIRNVLEDITPSSTPPLAGVWREYQGLEGLEPGRENDPAKNAARENFVRQQLLETLNRLAIPLEAPVKINSEYVGNTSVESLFPHELSMEDFRQAVQRINAWVDKGEKFDESKLLELFRIVSGAARDEDPRIREGSGYRTEQVYAIGWNFAPTEQVRPYMKEYLEWFSVREKELERLSGNPKEKAAEALIFAAQAFVRLAHLHPLPDFNERTSRLVMEFILVKNHLRPFVLNQTTEKEWLTLLRFAPLPREYQGVRTPYFPAEFVLFLLKQQFFAENGNSVSFPIHPASGPEGPKVRGESRLLIQEKLIDLTQDQLHRIRELGQALTFEERAGLSPAEVERVLSDRRISIPELADRARNGGEKRQRETETEISKDIERLVGKVESAPDFIETFLEPALVGEVKDFFRRWSEDDAEVSERLTRFERLRAEAVGLPSEIVEAVSRVTQSANLSSKQLAEIESALNRLLAAVVAEYRGAEFHVIFNHPQDEVVERVLRRFEAEGLIARYHVLLGQGEEVQGKAWGNRLSAYRYDQENVGSRVREASKLAKRVGGIPALILTRRIGLKIEEYPEGSLLAELDDFIDPEAREIAYTAALLRELMLAAENAGLGSTAEMIRKLAERARYVVDWFVRSGDSPVWELVPRVVLDYLVGRVVGFQA